MTTAAVRRGRMPAGLGPLIAVLVFTAFLTQVKFVPAIRNNVGPFEIVGALVILVFIVTTRSFERLEIHPTMRFLGGIVLVAAVSQINLPSTHRLFGVIQVFGLAFLALLVLALHNLAHRYRISPGSLLRLITISILVVGPWILLEGAQGDLQLAGPFRNRAHMGSYMLTAFWLVLAYSHWPGISKWQRRFAQIAMLMSIYGIAASGRRSVYLSFLVGLAALSASFVVARRGRRFAVLASGVLAIGFLASFYLWGSRLMPQAAFFQERIAMVDDRLRAAVSFDEGDAEAGSFFSMQRQGVRLAFERHPILGIGWGGFPQSVYSPTGHEVHSTPLRFIAETGILGIGLYTLFLLSVLATVTRQYLTLRPTPYGGASLALMLGVWSLAISYSYNRHLTERTFWLLLVVLLSIEAFVAAHGVGRGAARRRAPDPRIAAALPRPAPARLAAPLRRRRPARALPRRG